MGVVILRPSILFVRMTSNIIPGINSLLMTDGLSDLECALGYISVGFCTNVAIIL